jgi:prophage maintenance system killer protein
MSRIVSIGRLAKSAQLDPEDVTLALMERGVEVDDPDAHLDGTAHKAARAVIRELLGGPALVRPRVGPPAVVIEPARRSSKLHRTLSVDEVLFIHQRLCEDFAATSDPIDPPGVKSASLLESAVNRQESGIGDDLKYPNPLLNAATLLYGIRCDHQFHNGNKRTALVCALAHLDRNRLVLRATRQRELFRLMIAVADHAIVEREVKIGRDTKSVPYRGTPDEEVVAIRDWLEPRVEEITRGEASITYRELRQILGTFGFTIEQTRSQKVAICRREARGGLFGRREKHKTLMAIEWPGDGRVVSIGVVKHIRKTLKLCEEDGVTRDSFYVSGVRIDRFINEYRTVLRQLASR